jgi:HSP20 family molecular chaperone IbpA
MAVDVDKAFAASDTQARLLAQKKREIEAEKQALETDKALARNERNQAMATAKDKMDRDLVQISREADNQVSSAKKLHTDRLHSLDDNSQKHYEEIAGRTAEQIKRINDGSLKAINDRNIDSMERIRFVTERANDPFYRVQSLNPVMSESEREFQIKVSLPEHEAKNLLVTGDGPYIKLTLARRFQDAAKGEQSGRSTRTSSYQSVVEQLAVPSAYDAKGIKQEYQDGFVTIRIPKSIFGHPEDSLS